MEPELNRRRAVFVLGKIDEILNWEKSKEQEKDARFVELGEYLCEVGSKQYWRLEKLKSFDEFLARRFPDSRRTPSYFSLDSIPCTLTHSRLFSTVLHKLELGRLASVAAASR